MRPAATAAARRGGRATTIGGELLIWSEAEGTRGTRWREGLQRDGVLVRSLLLEVSAAGRPTRLEMTTAAGLLTLHPEPDESELHGNVVGPDGITHLAFPWSGDHELLILGSPASATITLRRLTQAIVVGATRTLEVLRIGDELDPRPARWGVERIARRAWHLREIGGSDERRLTVDDEGRPLLTDAVSWPLET
jgi:hypothetical protein